MAERIVRFIEGGDRFVLGQISVAGVGWAWAPGSPRRPAARGGHRGHPQGAGRRRRPAAGDAPAEPSTSQFMTLTQELVLGMDLSVPSPNRHYRTLPVQKGRFLREGDRHRVVIGASFATSRGLAPGSRLMLEGQAYEVVGVLDRMLTAPDRFVIVAIEDAREQWVAKDRLLRTVLASGGVALRAQDLNTGAAVGWRDGEDPTSSRAGSVTRSPA